MFVPHSRLFAVNISINYKMKLIEEALRLADIAIDREAVVGVYVTVPLCYSVSDHYPKQWACL